MMKRAKTGSPSLEDRFGCFGHFDPHDTLCTKWCLFNIRCAIARNKHEEQEIIEGLVELALEPYVLQ
jgi:hypothetical protein